MVSVTFRLNRAWGGEPCSYFTLVLGAIMAAAVGILLGAFSKHQTLFTVIKGPTTLYRR